eukprot:GHVT01090249.1.p1 GENE.GHVT01090249.1~~GHVT01090249.1.p1  ORF type:complete len:174 (-),score=29.09 GHVT01090249.1:335-856(-)
MEEEKEPSFLALVSSHRLFPTSYSFCSSSFSSFFSFFFFSFFRSSITPNSLPLFPGKSQCCSSFSFFPSCSNSSSSFFSCKSWSSPLLYCSICSSSSFSSCSSWSSSFLSCSICFSSFTLLLSTQLPLDLRGRGWDNTWIRRLLACCSVYRFDASTTQTLLPHSSPAYFGKKL